MKQHFVIFYSPGTIVSEATQKPISSWSIPRACDMAHGISERYNATPYAFKFITRERKDDELDSKIVAHSGMYYLGGAVETLAEIKAKNDPDNRILIVDMECNRWDRVVTNTNSWKSVHPLMKDDVVLDWTPRKKGPVTDEA